MDCHQCQKSCHRDKKGKNWWGVFSRTSLSKEMRSPDAQIALVGTPNVGKSLIFNKLTRVYVTVSNYPGTTVEVSRRLAKIGEQNILVVDTPGMYSLIPISDEERVARDLLFKESLAAVIHVVDAKNLGRMLPLTFQLIEAELPVLLVANMMDEADRLGLKVHPTALELELGIPVVLMSAALNRGVEALKTAIGTLLASHKQAISV
jgi:ferrous iron transport protein B